MGGESNGTTRFGNFKLREIWRGTNPAAAWFQSRPVTAVFTHRDARDCGKAGLDRKSRLFLVFFNVVNKIMSMKQSIADFSWCRLAACVLRLTDKEKNIGVGRFHWNGFGDFGLPDYQVVLSVLWWTIISGHRFQQFQQPYRWIPSSLPGRFR